MHLANPNLTGAVFFDAQLIRWVVWVGLVVFTVALLILVRTRWGHSQPLGKCIVLSLLAHLLIGIYATTVNIVTANVGSPDGKGIQVALIESVASEAHDGRAAEAEPWNALGGNDAAIAAGAAAAIAPVAARPLDLAPAEELHRQPTAAAKLSAPPPLERVAPPPAEDAGPPDLALAKPASERTTISSAAPLEPAPPVKTPADDVPPADPTVERPAESKPVQDPAPAPGDKTPLAGPAASPEGAKPAAAGSPDGTVGAGGASAKSVPTPYRQRVGDHLEVAKGFGATQDSEARVKAALGWLAANQSDSGRWEAHRLSGGAGLAADRQDRQAAGAQADSGITGLALLAFLAAGHTHLQGPHQTTVRHGLEYLLAVQDSNGFLGATNNQYERMYCHAMATCAISEAYAMTRDERLGPAVRRAINYTLAAQDRVTGGWRYHPGDPGDTSQLGWQVMALKSAELAGIDIPQATRDGIGRFLKSVAAGRSGGLARYQPNRGLPSRSMTAEALVCREFMGLSTSSQAVDEAVGYLLQEPPGAGLTNVYYWYYATLGMYQLQGDGWHRWNETLQKNLMATQRTDGELAGSWDPDPVWGGCGGRAYSTALSTLCLEVYYRFLPLHAEANAGRRPETGGRR